MPAADPGERRVIASIAQQARLTRQTGAEMMAPAQAAYRDSFRRGHTCEMCGTVKIDQSLPPDEIARRGEVAYKLHMRRLALRRDRSRRLAAKHAAAAAAAEAELALHVDAV